MTLLHADGFDSQMALSSGIYREHASYTASIPTFVTGRLGTGYAFQTQSDNTGSTNIRTDIPATTTIIAGWAWYPTTVYASRTENQASFIIGNTGTVLKVCFDPTTQAVTVRTGAESSTGTALATASEGVTLNTWDYWEIKVVASTGTSGSIILRKNGVEVANVTGINTQADSYNEVGFHLGGTSTYSAYSGAHRADDWYVCDAQGTVNNDFLGDVSVLAIQPSGNGSNSGLTGSDGDSTDNYALVDEAPPSTADYVGSATPGDKDTYAYSDIPTDGSIKGVMVRSYAAKSDTGTVSGRNVALHSGTTVNGTDAALSTDYKSFSTVLEDVPGGSGWTPAQVNAAEFGWEVRA